MKTIFTNTLKITCLVGGLIAAAPAPSFAEYLPVTAWGTEDGECTFVSVEEVGSQCVIGGRAIFFFGMPNLQQCKQLCDEILGPVGPI